MKVLVLDGVSPEGLNVLDREPGITVDIMDTMPEEELIKIIHDYNAIIIAGATKRGILVSNAHGGEELL